MKSLALTILILAVLNFQESKSQLKKNLDDIAKTTETLKNLIGKKKNKTEDSSKTANAGGNTSKNVSQSGTASKKTGGAPAPGDIATNAKFLEVDEMGPFNGGAAIVKKGEVNALIDGNGNLVTPFTKYELISTLETLDGAARLSNVKFSGFFVLDSVGHIKVLNAKGKYIGGNAPFKTVTEDGKYAVFFEDNKYLFIDADGKKIILPNTYIKNEAAFMTFFDSYANGLGAVLPPEAHGVATPVYINLKNQIVINGGFDYAGKFSEGLACVSKKNGYGEIKYGFIDMKGNTIIPFNYSNKPTNFSCGLSRIIPKDLSDFKCAFINKKGEIVIKCPQLFSEFKNGYAFKGNTMMDTTGKVFNNAKEFFSTLGVNALTPRESIWVIDADQAGMIHDGKVRFERTSQGQKVEDYNVNGYFDLASKKVVPFSFTCAGETKRSLLFDPVSGLAYAERYLGKDNTGKSILRKGYINNDGMFVIVMKAPDTKF